MKLFAAKPMFAPAKSLTTVRRVFKSRARRTLAGFAAVALGTLAVLATSATAEAAQDGPLGVNPGSRSGNGSVGTLPAMGGSGFPGLDFTGLDQTITLRGTSIDIREALVSATGDFLFEAIQLGNGQLWVRFYGDVQLELNLAALADVEVSIFTGFEGDGLAYSVGQTIGFGNPRRVGVGGDIRLDPLRLKVAGLLDEPLFVACLHQTGARTLTSLEFQPVDGVVVIRQDV